MCHLPHRHLSAWAALALLTLGQIKAQESEADAASGPQNAAQEPAAQPPDAQAGGRSPALKVATVDLQHIFIEYYQTQQLLDDSNLRRAQIYKEIIEQSNDVGNKINREISAFQQNLQDDRDLSEEERLEELEQEKNYTREEKLRMIKLADKKMRNRLKRLETNVERGIENKLKELRLLIADYAEAQGYDIVFDLSGDSTSQISPVVHLSQSTDITEEILAKINKKAPQDR